MQHMSAKTNEKPTSKQQELRTYIQVETGIYRYKDGEGNITYHERPWVTSEIGRSTRTYRALGFGFTRQTNLNCARTGDLLEWLARSQPTPRSETEVAIPLGLLAAACFQLAGLPALAYGFLRQHERTGGAEVFSCFFMADFTGTLDAATEFWGQHSELTRPADELVYDFQDVKFFTAELVRCLGLIAVGLRTNQRERVDLAIRKLQALARVGLRARREGVWLITELTYKLASRFSKQTLWSRVETLRSYASETGRV